MRETLVARCRKLPTWNQSLHYAFRVSDRTISKYGATHVHALSLTTIRHISAIYKDYYTRQTAQNATVRSISFSGQWLPYSARRCTAGNTNKWPAYMSALFYIGTSVNNFLAVCMPSDRTPPEGSQHSPGFMVVQQLCPGVPSNSVLDSKYLGFFPSH